jgi:hypothetical protein
VVAKGKQFLLFLRYPLCYSYIQSGQKFGSDRGKKKSTQKVKDPLSFEITICSKNNESVTYRHSYLPITFVIFDNLIMYANNYLNYIDICISVVIYTTLL